MIIGWMFNKKVEDAFAAIIMILFYIIIFVGIGVYHSYLFFGWIYSSVALFVLTEASYHLEPRSISDKNRGRGYGKVALKKIDSLFDAILIVALFTGGYKVVKLFNLASVLKVLLNIGLVILIILGIVGLIFGYLWLNKLRDRPKKKKEKNGR